MREYFDISYEKNRVLDLKSVSEEALMINIIELKKQDYKIIAIKDTFGEYHDEEEIIEIYKESIDIEYEDVTTKIEAYDLAFEYYKKLYNSSYIKKETYDRYIKTLNKYKREIKNKDIFIEKIKDLYISGV